ncbi:MAG: DUF1501 domain-containing protein [Opitutae bacterium]|nr:DUF1501 domain-containing protein [Opitutae bacterium]MBT4223268.1 DUF1501 domain-containing protein [Opitutae bacterium]MBT5381200.1 DUF1501 domain-containing protein [Opitutae bacterium]MBT6461238.1 DUF1501 domain-containing protein [Opitutae bacterium]
MLTIDSNHSHQTCDGYSRREFLKVGSLAMGGLSLPQLLQAESKSKQEGSGKAVIMVYLAGGPTHHDTFDLKDDAPLGIRGEFRSIKTAATGVRVCELLPKIAAQMDECSIIRSISDTVNSHSSYHVMTGKSKKVVAPPGGWPGIGSVFSKKFGISQGTPAYLDLGGGVKGGGFLGSAYAGFSPSGKGQADMKLNGVTTDRFGDRQLLLNCFDNLRRDIDSSGIIEGMDAFNQEAVNVITSNRLLTALDTRKEDPKTVERYGKTGRNFMLARRLVEAGARFVTLSTGGWDTHNDNFNKCRKILPDLDRGVGNLIQDLRDRNMLDDVTVVVWGEFGRTPKINSKGGRDHWSRVMSVLLAGGGMNNGQVVGSSDRHGGEPAERPVRLGEVFSTLYHNCGIDSTTLQFNDLTGRPQYIVDPNCTPIKELVG